MNYIKKIKEVFNIENEFILNSTVENRTDNKSNDLILTGIASTTKEPSLYGEIMTEEALQQMQEQAVNLPILEAHKGDGFDNVIGVITNAYVENNDLHIDFKILQNHRQRIQELIDNNVPIGLSIGAQAHIDQDTQQVIGVTLIEVSLTPVPANRVAHNTVRVKEDYYVGNCLHNICYAMIKDNFKMEDNNMVEKEKKVNPEVKDEDSLTIDKVKDMLDERFAEEKEVLVATVVEEVKTELKKLNDKVEETFKIEDAVKKEEKKSKAKGESEEEEEEPKAGASEDNSESEEKPEAEEEGEGEGEGGASEEEDEDKKKKDKKKVKESAPVIDEDKIVESITERILDSLGEKRDVTGTKTEAALKNDSTEKVEEAKPFTSEEAAKLIINDMNRRDPLARAINEAINQ